jgi:hypothetical protein
MSRGVASSEPRGTQWNWCRSRPRIRRRIRICVLKRVVPKPEGMVAQVITEVPVDYKVETSAKYKEVRIRPDRVRVRVKIVQ